MLCEGLMPQARGDHISQTHIEPVYYCCKIVQHLRHPGALYGTNQSNTLM